MRLHHIVVGSTAALALAAGAPAMAQDDCSRILLDMDADGRVIESEYAAYATNFDAYDTNGDGIVDETEYQSCAEVTDTPFHPDFWVMLDANEDSRLDRDEFFSADASRWMVQHDNCSRIALDMDADGRVGESEYAAYATNFELYDTNDDGVIDETEYQTCYGASIGPLHPDFWLAQDANQDSRLDAGEFFSPEAHGSFTYDAGIETGPGEQSGG